ncbi:MAG: FmdB family zinc ribbon protein [Dethiobacteria bacterium]|jgi:putative FmdB family regulatory protein
MPTYEFLCKKCGEKFTVFTSFSRKDESKCPRCSSSDLRQLYSGFSVLGSSGGGCQPPPRGGFS